MAGIAATGKTKGTSLHADKNYTSALAVLTSLFFMWAVATGLNDILIPHLKKACDLTDFQSSFIQSAFFGGYFLMSLPAGWIIKKIGYKSGIIVGLITCAAGALIFYPAAVTRVYGLFLFALCVLAGGITILQVAANAYVAILGRPETSSSRLNLAQAFNSLGATVGPYLGAKLILAEVEKTEAELASLTPEQLDAYRIGEAAMVKMPYIGLALIFLLVAAIIYFSNLPKIEEDDEDDSEDFANVKTKKTSVFQYSHLVYGVIAIFVYVGAEVGIASFIIRYMQYLQIPEITEQKAALYVSIYMFGAMVGRFIGSALLQRINAGALLAFNSLLAGLLLIGSIMLGKGGGMLAVYLVVAVGFFNSIMFPTIFTLSIKGLGKFTKMGSSLLIMAIVGGGIVPPVMGYISDIQNIQLAFIAPAICYIYVFFFGAKGAKVKEA